MSSPNQLLQEFSRTRSESAFRELMVAHFDLVFATALRQMGGDAHAAQDVAQEVFTLLARKAKRLPRNVALGGWLYRQTCRRSSNLKRGESRRRRREQAAALEESDDDHESNELWEEIAPELDEAMLALPSKDRDAVVLRFLEGRSHRGVGEQLGISEGAARQRVARAIERLRSGLSRRGVAVSITPLAAALSANALMPAPASAAESVVRKVSIGGSSGLVGTIVGEFPALVGGAVVGLLVTGIAAASRSDESPHQPTAKPVSERQLNSPSPRGSRPVKLAMAQLSLEQILSRLQELLDAPEHELTKLERAALVDSIPADSFAQFVDMAMVKLDQVERAGIFEQVFDRWSQLDPEQAIASMLAHQIDAFLKPSYAPLFLNHLCSDWREEDPVAAGRWFVENIAEVGDRLTPAWQSQTIANTLFKKKGMQETLAFIKSLPSAELQIAAVHDLLYDSYPGGPQRDDPESWLGLIDGVGELEDAALVSKLRQQLWGRWGRIAPGKANAAAEALTDPLARYTSALGLAGVQYLPGTLQKVEDGAENWGVEKVADGAERVAVVLAAAEEAGIPRGEAIRRAFELKPHQNLNDPAVRFLIANRTGTELDEPLAAIARRALSSLDKFFVGGDMSNFLKASTQISDVETRDRIVAGGLRLLVFSSRDAAIRMLDSHSVPPEIKTRIRTLLDGEP